MSVSNLWSGRLRELDVRTRKFIWSPISTLSFAKNDPASAWRTVLHVSELAQLRIQMLR
jgi:hypothetical protein